MQSLPMVSYFIDNNLRFDAVRFSGSTETNLRAVVNSGFGPATGNSMSIIQAEVVMSTLMLNFESKLSYKTADSEEDFLCIFLHARIRAELSIFGLVFIVLVK